MKLPLILFLIFLCGCQSYPRYSSEPPAPPEERSNSRESFSTERYIDLGMILRKYLGKPYKGTSRYDVGVDCSMFTHDVFRAFNGMELPRTAEDQYKIGKNVPLDRMSFGDLVFFRTERGKKITHVGIYVGGNEFIHASTSRGVIISSLREKYWAKAFVSGRRILE